MDSRGERRSDLVDGHPGPGAGAGAAPTSVKDVLQSTSLTILEAHLTWLCARTRLEGQLSPRRVLFEDQARVLIDALDERGALEVVTGSLQSLWIAEDVPDDDDDITTYASDLDMVTAGQPPYSPYVALAQSAAKVHAEIRNHRRSTSPLRPG